MPTPLQRLSSFFQKAASDIAKLIIPEALGASDTHHFLEDRSIPLRRLKALLIDLTICGSIALFLIALSQLALFFLGCGFLSYRSKLISLALFLLPLWFAFVLIITQLWISPAVFESSKLQATPGMYFMKLVSFDITGTRLTFFQITRRLLVQWLITGFCFLTINLDLHVKLDGRTLPLPGVSLGIGWLPIISWALLTFFFALAFIRKDSRNIFDICGHKIVQNSSEIHSKLKEETNRPNFLNRFSRVTMILILYGNLAGMVCFILAAIGLNISGYVALEKSMHQTDLLIKKDSNKELSLSASHKANIQSQFPLIESYYYAKATIPVQQGKEEQLTLLSKAILIRERGIFYNRRANLLQSLGRHREAILDYDKALNFADTGDDGGDILYSTPPHYTKTTDKPFYNISFDQKIYSKVMILKNRGMCYLEQAKSNKNDYDAQRLAHCDLIAAKEILSDELNDSPCADKYEQRALINRSLGNIQEAIKDEKEAQKL